MTDQTCLLTHSADSVSTSLAEHAGLYRSFLGPQGSARVIDHIRRCITAGALIGVATDWLQGGCTQTPDDMAAATWPMRTAHYRATEVPSATRSAPRSQS